MKQKTSINWPVLVSLVNCFLAMLFLALLPPFHRVDLSLWAATWMWLISSGACYALARSRQAGDRR
nr:MAG TPA: hypothetical protein [Caudoviricetes sp.]